MERKTLKLFYEIKAKENIGLRQIAGIVQDKEVTCASKSWGEFKTRTELVPCSIGLVMCRISLKKHKKWTEYEATDALHGETQREYRYRVGTRNRELIKPSIGVIDGWFSRRMI